MQLLCSRSKTLVSLDIIESFSQLRYEKRCVVSDFTPRMHSYYIPLES